MSLDAALLIARSGLTAVQRALAQASQNVANAETPGYVRRSLPQREQTILHLRFFEGLTQSEIATRLGISQMHVSRLLARSLALLRTSADDS